MNQLNYITSDTNESDNQIKAVIFDFDGVLSSLYVRIAGPIIVSAKRIKPDLTQDEIEESTLTVMSTLNAANKKPSTISLIKYGFKMGKRMGVSNFQVIQFVLSALFFYMRYRKRIMPKIGVREVLRKIITQGYKVVLVTNTSTSVIKAAKKKIPELDSFDLILTRDDVKDIKPNATAFFVAMRTLGLKANEVISIGDQASDIIAGKRAGIRTIGIYHPSLDFLKSHLAEQNPDFIIKDIRQLPGLLHFLRDYIIDNIRSTIDLTEKTLQDYFTEAKLSETYA
jgi:HAD superfamily hydrolase (TIGR01549 family)